MTAELGQRGADDERRPRVNRLTLFEKASGRIGRESRSHSQQSVLLTLNIGLLVVTLLARPSFVRICRKPDEKGAAKEESKRTYELCTLC